jgi:hypothetical protein
MKAEGWYRDPYAVHEDRWYSDGIPTALVRDAEVEGHDPPPSDVPPKEPFEPSLAHGEPPGPDDLRRADEAETPDAPDAPDYSQKVFDVIGETIRPL